MAAVLAASVLLPAGLATAATPASSKIVFASQQDGLWLVNGDGSGLREIASTGTATQSSPSFSPDGSQIAYSQNGEIWLVNASGGTPRQLTHSGGSAFTADWSPNGRWIAFTEFVDSGSDVFRISPGGGRAQRISYAAQHGCYANEPAWSPDSASIAYARGGNGTTCKNGGLVVQQLGHNGTVVVPGAVESPSFTPVGNLVYVAQCGDPSICGDIQVGWAAAANGTNRHMVETRYLCREGDLCVGGMRGLPRPYSRGWVEQLAYYNENDPISDAVLCFQGGYQTATTVARTAPQFCLSGMLSNGFDVT